MARYHQNDEWHRRVTPLDLLKASDTARANAMRLVDLGRFDEAEAAFAEAHKAERLARQ